MVGARVAVVPRFSVSNFWPEVERSGATIASILGSMGGLLANAPDCEAAKRCFGQIHTVRGNPFTEPVKAIWRERFGAKQVGGNGYGLTEAAVITSLPAGEYAAPGSSGKRMCPISTCASSTSSTANCLLAIWLARSSCGRCAPTSCSWATGAARKTRRS
jgi:acyl-CoA synthetase (AMP-forming)/AMP-acid ligase II